jgi:hypothetical protein
MLLSELKYITQEHIDEAHINITSPEMYAEARDFNTHMLRMRRKRVLFLTDYWLMLGFTFLSFLAGQVIGWFRRPEELCGFLMEPWIVSTLITWMFIFLFCYFIIYRKMYNWKAGLLISLIPVPVTYIFLITAAANAVILRMIDKTDRSIRDEAGYPHFVELRLTYIRPEQEEEERKENPYSTYIKPPEDGSGFLFDSGADVFSAAEDISQKNLTDRPAGRKAPQDGSDTMESL